MGTPEGVPPQRSPGIGALDGERRPHEDDAAYDRTQGGRRGSIAPRPARRAASWMGTCGTPHACVWAREDRRRPRRPLRTTPVGTPEGVPQRRSPGIGALDGERRPHEDDAAYDRTQGGRRGSIAPRPARRAASWMGTCGTPHALRVRGPGTTPVGTPEGVPPRRSPGIGALDGERRPHEDDAAYDRTQGGRRGSIAPRPARRTGPQLRCVQGRGGAVRGRGAAEP